MAEHKLKLKPSEFDKLKGKKKFVLHVTYKNRRFVAGDTVVLQRTDDQGFVEFERGGKIPKQSMRLKIAFAVDGEQFCKKRHCVLCLVPITE